MSAASHHDSATARKHGGEMGSERSFGLVFTVVMAVIGTLRWYAGGGDWPGWYVAAGVFLTVALGRPNLLRHLNLLWYRFGLLLHAVVNPIVMGLLFFGTVVPTAVIMRAIGRRPLHLAFDAKAATYWIRREPPGPAPESLRDQF